ncbi:MAG: TonB-dependent receptor [Sphingobacteriales bacterium]|nr:TonB-dependent receptor [Sphingobacteriales bacterium]
MKRTLFLIALITALKVSAQEGKISGVIKDDNNATLPGATIKVENSSRSTVSDANGRFSIVAKLNEVLVISYIGFETKSVKVTSNNLSIILKSNGGLLKDVVVVGSRNPARTVTESAVPIDVINVQSLITQGAQVTVNSILNMVAPSFTSNTQTVADGTDHIDPAQLRGLGPDQVLVLVNGKRRHTSSLVNINGSPGRGSVGTDMNAIPAFAIDKIEVLRDGASAQYGSDAIAGVININIKKNTNKLDVSLYSGGNFSKGANNHQGGVDGGTYQLDLNYGTGLGKPKSFINFTGSLQLRDATSRAKDATGTLFSAFNAVEERAAKAGMNINALFGNINNTPNGPQILTAIKTYAPQVSYFTAAQQAAIAAASSIPDMQNALKFDATEGELAYRGLQRGDFDMRVGQSSLKGSQFFVNAAYPISKNVEAYAFGGTSFRNGNAAGFYRRPNQSRAYTALYPNGFLPEIHSNITDLSIAAGIRGKFFTDWNFDLSNTFGKNAFDYNIENTLNATLRENSPLTFNAGGLAFSQNTVNFDISKKVDFLKGFNLAFGTEYRHENFQIKAGQPESYNSYDINNNVVTGTTPSNLKPTDFYGSVRPGGSQVFPGFRPANALSKGRNSVALYSDLELDVTSKFLLNGAVRYENYSDFGNTINFKLASRYKLTSNINLRGAVSTGFRAPSLHQIYFNSTSTQFVGGVPFEVGIFSNDSYVAKTLGIPSLKQEKSNSVSIGFTAKIPAANLTITADAYTIKINNRIVLTDQFARPTNAGPLQSAFDAANATAAAFFANAIDTKSEGIDLVISNTSLINNSSTFKSDFAATISKTHRVGDIHASQLLLDAGQVGRYYSESSRVYLEEAIPRVKANLSHTLTVKKFDFFLRNVYFGKVTDPNIADVNNDGNIGATEHPVWSSRIITDLSVGYKIGKGKPTRFVIGANNVFDIYPDRNLESLSNSNQFIYSRNVSQFGFNGRFLFARLTRSF